MINKFEAIGIFASIGFMVLALFLLRVDSIPALVQNPDSTTQVASIAVVDEANENQREALYGTLIDSIDDNGKVNKLIVDDVVIGSGQEVKEGDLVTVHYIGTLDTGQQFDNSNTRGEPFTFTIGQNRVIEGWEKGLIGMKVGGERILVIPPEMGYGAQNVGPIPANSTLVFSISLLSINQ